MSYDPEPVRALGSEATLDEVRTSIRLTCRAGRDRLTAAAHALQACGPHEAGDLVTADLPPGAAHRVVHLAHPVDAVVLGMDPLDLLQEQDVSQGPRGGWSCLRGAVAHVEVMNPHSVARRVRQMASTEELIAVFVDERDHLVVGRSSSAAKKAEAALRISFARRASASSRLSLRISSAGVSEAGAWATSWPWRWHHIRKVSSLTSSCGATARMECERGPPCVA